MKIEWSPRARALARRYLADQDGMRAIAAAVASLSPCCLPVALRTVRFWPGAGNYGRTSPPT